MWPTCTQREDLLLDNYSWVDPSQRGAQGKVRIPIERAMELIAQRGLPVAPAVATANADGRRQHGPQWGCRLTNGFARTGFEQDAGRSTGRRIEAEAAAVGREQEAGTGLKLRRQASGPRQRQPPAILNGVGIAQRLNQQLPLNLTFHRRRGQAGASRQTTSASGPPSSRWFTTSCPMLCSEELNGLTSALADGALRSRQGLQHRRGQHRSQRRHRSGRGQEAQLPQALRPS
jgi:hypothetical protein